MKKNTQAILLCFLFMICNNVIIAQIQTDRKQTDLQRTVNIKDLRPQNDPNFVPKGHHETNEEDSELEGKKKNKDSSREHPFEPSLTAPVRFYDQQRLMINEIPCIGYSGMRHGNYIPPDVSGAVGHDHIVMTENDSFRIQEKNGTVNYQQLHQDPTGFWSGMFANSLFDPKMIYDPYAKRWIHVILADPQLSTSSILIAVSVTPDPYGSWYQWTIDADAENDQWLDYPSIGFNNTWLAINGVMFPTPNSGADQESRMFVFRLSELYAGLPLNWSVFSTDSYSHIVPALTYDPNYAGIWCATNDDTDDNDIRFFLISGDPNAPDFTEGGYISISGDWGQGGIDLAPQFGSSSAINTGDHRIRSVIWRFGKLFTSQSVFFPDGGSPSTSTIQVVICDPLTTTVHEAIRFVSNETSMYSFSNLVVNGNEDLVMSCARFTNSIFPSACVIVRRNGDPTWYENIYKAGEDWYVNYDSSNPARNRWGDYTAASVDPSDDQSVWIAGEYSRPRIGTTGRWGTQWAKVCPGVCNPTAYMFDQPAGTYKKYEASQTVYAGGQINNTSNIKLDGGTRVVLLPGFKALYGSKMRTYIEGCNGPQ